MYVDKEAIRNTKGLKTINGFTIRNGYICKTEHRLTIFKEFLVEGTKDTITIQGVSDPDTPEQITKLFDGINTYRDLKRFFKTQTFLRTWHMF